MRTLEELRHFYDGTLLADLKVLDRKRETTIERLVISYFLLLGIAGGLFLMLLTILNPNQAAMLSLGLCIVLGICASVLLIRAYAAEFKRTIIGKMVKFMDENLDYLPAGFIPKATFVASKIFGPEITRYKGEDLVSGKIGATEIQFSEIEVAYGARGDTYRGAISFDGLFFVGAFNKDFTAQIVVLPDVAERLLVHVGQKLQALTKFRGQLIKLEDPEFEKFFAVYSDDQIQARYVLSTSLMEKVVEFRKKANKEIFLSFIESKVYVAVPLDRDLFEPRLSTTLLDFGLVREYFEDLRLAIGIVDDLNLNTRIWSKE
jgi:hypothetical protein